MNDVSLVLQSSYYSIEFKADALAACTDFLTNYNLYYFIVAMYRVRENGLQDPEFLCQLVQRGVFLDNIFFGIISRLILRDIYRAHKVVEIWQGEIDEEQWSNYGIESELESKITCLQMILRSTNEFGNIYSLEKVLSFMPVLGEFRWFDRFSLKKSCRLVIMKSLFAAGNYPNGIYRLYLPKILEKFILCEID